ncbi:hypothetical protein A1O3_02934 [Capronia epimyces CBS 606.96]|uniref:Methylated-DNA--protein-cysteine methyltransferase n=1 Tax=Capronia epimyces CBS 606.96 TaxID=1182542 RepID=W9YAL8_9EURO|nr:uncharacterized protein A1O3_02934 [Capronia epimyces CBS 606.96]EXJ89867.1 hypothetical protein A1O3_02934 [Capronia epimyces CBS 606.96]
MSDRDGLRKQWTALYAHTLPQLAKNRSPVQPIWPVTLDHCFSRIILDYVIGHGERQWDHIIGKPAVRNMTEQQLHDAIALGQQIKSGEVDLLYLDELSLHCRRKHEKTLESKCPMSVEPAPSASVSRKRSMEEHTDSTQNPTIKRTRLEKRQSTLHFSADMQPSGATFHRSSNLDLTSEAGEANHELKRTLQRVRSHPSLTQYRKKLYLTLLSVPRGRYTTYAAMSDYLNSSARAVGGGMRNNPFAPEVPCHRVLAANGTIGGFCGDWGKDGKFANKKIALLRSEGVRFDGNGKVVGEPFRQFHSFEHIE